MNTLIVYGSTYGYAKGCAESLAKKLQGNVDVVDAANVRTISLTQYDKVIIGGSIYMGQIQKKVKEFCTNNLGELMNKKVALFICCGFIENEELNMRNAFPLDLQDKAVAKECFGGILNVDKMKFIHKFITKMISKATAKDGKKDAVTLPQNIEKLAQIMNSV